VHLQQKRHRDIEATSAPKVRTVQAPTELLSALQIEKIDQIKAETRQLLENSHRQATASITTQHNEEMLSLKSQAKETETKMAAQLEEMNQGLKDAKRDAATVQKENQELRDMMDGMRLEVRKELDGIKNHHAAEIAKGKELLEVRFQLLHLSSQSDICCADRETARQREGRRYHATQSRVGLRHAASHRRGLQSAEGVYSVDGEGKPGN